MKQKTKNLIGIICMALFCILLFIFLIIISQPKNETGDFIKNDTNLSLNNYLVANHTSYKPNTITIICKPYNTLNNNDVMIYIYGIYFQCAMVEASNYEQKLAYDKSFKKYHLCMKLNETEIGEC